MEQGYYIDNKGKKVILESDIFINVSYRNIKELVIPQECKYVHCYNNQIKELIIPPQGCQYVLCFNNQLSKLILPQGCEVVFCYNNQIKELVLPQGCKIVRCDYDTVLINKENCEDINYIF